MKLNFVNGENDKLMSDDNGIKKFTIKMTENKAILRKKCLFGISNLEFLDLVGRERNCFLFFKLEVKLIKDW